VVQVAFTCPNCNSPLLGVSRPLIQPDPLMKPIFLRSLALLILASGGSVPLRAAHHSAPTLSATASLSSHGVMPGKSVELIVTVRNAAHPVIAGVDRPTSFRMHSIKKPQLLKTERGDVWLFRYRIVPTEVGEYEIPPILVTDDSARASTFPLKLRVSLSGKPPVLTAEELSRSVNIPKAISEEFLKNAPQTPPKADPSPTPVDTRPFTERASSTCWKLLGDFWNYPGK